jgi:hypothetical protein
MSKHHAESKPSVPPLALPNYALQKVRCHENVSWDSNSFFPDLAAASDIGAVQARR